MGNCSPSPRSSRRRSPSPSSPSPSSPSPSPSPLAPKPHPKTPTTPITPKPTTTTTTDQINTIHIYGSDSCPIAWRLRVSLLYKSTTSSSTTVQFTPTDTAPLGRPVLRVGPTELTGTPEELLGHIDGNLATKPLVSPQKTGVKIWEEVEEAVRLQHRSMERHLEAVVNKVGEMVKKTKKVKVKGKVVGVGIEAVDGRRVGRWYGDVMEVMLEHARMEEKLLFPELERLAHPGVCNLANEQHGRHLPMMNGIKEEIKTLLTLELGSPVYQEVLLNLSTRLKTLQEQCKEHFKEEEKELLPRLEAVHRMQREEGDSAHRSNSGWAAQVMGAMEVTHSRLFPFFMSGLLPQEAMQYLDLVCRCIKNTKQLVSILRSLAIQLEDANPSIIHNNPTKLYEHLLVSSP